MRFAWRCIFGHQWKYHNLVGDWFCNRCRKRKADIGIKKTLHWRKR